MKTLFLIAIAIASIVMGVAVTSTRASSGELASLKILYIGDAGSTRAAAVTDFLRQHVGAIDTVDRNAFDTSQAKPYDVVVLDWPQTGDIDAMKHLRSPLGNRNYWGKPTVLLGSAGLNLAVAWQVQGGSGCTCMDPLA